MKEFPTSDLQLASFLRLLGHEPVRIEGAAQRKVFVFQSVPECDLRDYYRGERHQPAGIVQRISDSTRPRLRLAAFSQGKEMEMVMTEESPLASSEGGEALTAPRVSLVRDVIEQ